MLRTAALALGVLLLAGCTGDGDEDDAASPADVLAEAKTTLDGTSGVRFSLATDQLPDDVTGLISADGVLTDAPAFEGSIVVRYLGFEPEVPVVAVDGTVYAQVPLTTGWQQIDPAEYGAPDPATLLADEGGLSDLLPATTDVEEGEQVRGGANNDEILTEYTGTVPGDAVQAIIPTATGDFDVTYTIADADGGAELRAADLTGAFYGDASGELTYRVSLDEYDVEQEITAP